MNGPRYECQGRVMDALAVAIRQARIWAPRDAVITLRINPLVVFAMREEQTPGMAPHHAEPPPDGAVMEFMGCRAYYDADLMGWLPRFQVVLMPPE